MHNIIKTFEVLTQIIGYYSSLPITTHSLDCHLTFEILFHCHINQNQLNIGSAERVVLASLLSLSNKQACKPARNRQNKEKKQIQHSKIQSQCPSVSALGNSAITQTSTAGSQQTWPTQQFSDIAMQDKQKYLFTVILLHQHGNTTTLNRWNLLDTIMHKIDNIIVVDSRGDTHNNLLHYHPHMQHRKYNNIRPAIILIPMEHPKGKNSHNINKGEKQKNQEYRQYYDAFVGEMEQYEHICNVYYGHINMRICAYSQPCNKHIPHKIKHYLSILDNYSNSEDDLDVLLRAQIPNSAHIAVIKQCGNRVGYQYIAKNSQQFHIIHPLSQHSAIPFYIYTLPHEDDNKGIVAADTLIIWVCTDGMPIMMQLPSLHAMNNTQKYKYNYTGNNKLCKVISKMASNPNNSFNNSCKNEKFNEYRSFLGYSIIQMENKICSQAHPFNGHNQKPHNQEVNHNNDNDRSGDSDDDSTCLNTSQISDEELPPPASTNSRKTPPCICVINLVKCANFEACIPLVQQQMCKIFNQFLRKRKDIQQNITIMRNLAMVKTAARLLQVGQRDIEYMLYLHTL